MINLEDQIEELVQLDDFRVRSAKWRDEGLYALQNRPLESTDRDWFACSDDVVEDAVHVKAGCLRSTSLQPPAELVNKLENLGLDDILGEPFKTQDRPVLRAAKAMQALVAAPNSAFTQAAFFYYYCIIRELYTTDAPDWRTGGARAGESGRASAYVTGECLHALLGFAKTLDQTAQYLWGLNSIIDRSYGLRIPGVPPAWSTAETKRLHMNFIITLKSLSGNLALRLPPPPREMGDALETYISELPDRIRERVRESENVFSTAEVALTQYRAKEEDIANGDSALQTRFDRSQVGHTVAITAIQAAVREAKSASTLGDKEPDPLLYLEGLAKNFQRVARNVRKLLHPAKGFVQSILDRELAAAALEPNMNVDLPELVFAATSHGYLRNDWSDERLRSAARLFSTSLSRRGRYPWGRPYHYEPLVVKYHSTAAEALRAAAILLRRTVGVTVKQETAEKILQFFEDTRVSLSHDKEAESGWFPEDFPQPSRGYRRYTAEAVLALDRFNEMLDAQINEQVFRHFSVKRGKSSGSPRLEDLFFPDYGLLLAPSSPNDGPVRRDTSVATLLERMRAHVLNVHSPFDAWTDLHSIVLHGPPGTGKTTLIEALARSCGATLVEVTPSDIVIGGGEAIERRARAVFNALSLLTGAVILFDEFDPIIRRRDPDVMNPTTVFSFLTPGMLPKLKTLNRAARRRRVAFALITNLIGELDPAAVRTGRFDARVGIYPPDLLSRAGRLRSELSRFLGKSNRQFAVDEEELVRFEEVIRKSAGLPMQALGSTGWFVQPRGSTMPPRSPFEFILQGGADSEPAWPEPEAELDGVLGKGRAAEQEYRQWAWIQAWDAVLEKEQENLDAILAAPPDQIPKIKKPRRSDR